MEYIQSVSVSGRAEAEQSWAHSLANMLSRIRFQLVGGLIVGVVAPAFIRGRFERFDDQLSSYEHSIIGTVCALLLGYLIFRKMTVLPGARAITNVVPAFMSSYTAVVAFFFLMRIDYSRYQFLVSFIFACLWFAAILFVVARFRRPVFCVVPGSHMERLKSYRGVRWKMLKSPRFLDRYPHMPVVVNFSNSSLEARWERKIAEEAIKGRRILSATQLAESLTGRVSIGCISENSFGHLAPDSLYAPAKRYVDIISAIGVILLFWPIMAITALAIRLESKGPAIFKQERMGFRGETFTVFKFRSMTVQNESDRDLLADKTQENDQRITRVGRFIRKTRIDELPQVFNILRGEMSWIGPRPETLLLSNWYEEQIPFYRYRHIVRPGLSGWAQVKQGHVTEVEDIRLKLEYDMFYVKNFSIWLDLLIAVKTISVVFTGKGAR